MTWDEMQQLAIDTVTCPHCGAKRGQRCVTKSGRRIGTHARRTDPVQKAWHGGYVDGRQDLLDSAIDNPAWFARRVEEHRISRGSTVRP